MWELGHAGKEGEGGGEDTHVTGEFKAVGQVILLFGRHGVGRIVCGPPVGPKVAYCRQLNDHVWSVT